MDVKQHPTTELKRFDESLGLAIGKCLYSVAEDGSSSKNLELVLNNYPSGKKAVGLKFFFSLFSSNSKEIKVLRKFLPLPKTDRPPDSLSDLISAEDPTEIFVDLKHIGEGFAMKSSFCFLILVHSVKCMLR